MGRILIIGGYGGFGARLSKRLAERGHSLLVGGRTEARARQFCATLEGAQPVVVDRQSGIGDMLERERPDLVIDAAGPFQASGYRVPEACIAAGISYLDLADATQFVTGIDTLDQKARSAAVAVISGASSVPGLTGAIVRKLADGMDAVHTVDIALSAANRATGGASVIDAILSYVGRPVRLWRFGRWTTVPGWQEMQRRDFLLSDGGGLRGRFVAVADVPDCAILPEMLPGRPAVTFRAGTEVSAHMLALWLASWPVSWGWITSLAASRKWLLPLYRLTERVGGERSAMSISVVGVGAGQAIERSWTIIAEKGQGLEIPTLAAELLAQDIMSGAVAPGARTAAELLTFERFEPLLAKLAVRYEFAETNLPPPLYRRVLGEAFGRLPREVRMIHDLHAEAGAAGEGLVHRGHSLGARLLGAAMRMPPQGRWPLHVAFSERKGVETWTRDFGGHRFSSRLSKAGPLLVEQFGPVRFHFELPADAGGLAMRLVRWTIFGVPLPRLMGPKIAARETEEDGQFRFDVRVEMPLIGHVVSYSGWLVPLQKNGAAAPRLGLDTDTRAEPARVPVG